MVRTGRLEEAVLGSRPGAALRVLLESTLGALERGQRGLQDELRIRQVDQPVADRLEPEVQVQRPGQGLERRGQERRPTATTTLRLALARGTAARPEVDPAGEAGETGGRDDGRAAGGQGALVVVGVARVERAGDGQVDDGVAEVLQPLVVTGAPRPDARGSQLEWTRACSSRSRSRTGSPRRSATACPGRTRPRDAATRWSARRCSRRRPGRSGSSPRPRPRSPSRTLLPGS